MAEKKLSVGQQFAWRAVEPMFVLAIEDIAKVYEKEPDRQYTGAEIALAMRLHSMRVCEFLRNGGVE